MITEDYSIRSRAEVARELGMTEEGVRQAERRAIRKLRVALLAEFKQINPALAQKFINALPKDRASV